MVPGATYLEMVLAAGEFHLNCKDKQWNIRKARGRKITNVLMYIVMHLHAGSMNICIEIALLLMIGYSHRCCSLFVIVLASVCLSPFRLFRYQSFTK